MKDPFPWPPAGGSVLVALPVRLLVVEGRVDGGRGERAAHLVLLGEQLQRIADVGAGDGLCRDVASRHDHAGERDQLNELSAVLHEDHRDVHGVVGVVPVQVVDRSLHVLANAGVEPVDEHFGVDAAEHLDADGVDDVVLQLRLSRHGDERMDGVARFSDDVDGLLELLLRKGSRLDREDGQGHVVLQYGLRACAFFRGRYAHSNIN